MGELIIEATGNAAKCGSYRVFVNPNELKLNATEKLLISPKKRIEIQGVPKNDLQMDIDLMSE